MTISNPYFKNLFAILLSAGLLFSSYPDSSAEPAMLKAGEELLRDSPIFFPGQQDAFEDNSLLRFKPWESSSGDDVFGHLVLPSAEGVTATIIGLESIGYSLENIVKTVLSAGADQSGTVSLQVVGRLVSALSAQGYRDVQVKDALSSNGIAQNVVAMLIQEPAAPTILNSASSSRTAFSDSGRDNFSSWGQAIVKSSFAITQSGLFSNPFSNIFPEMGSGDFLAMPFDFEAALSDFIDHVNSIMEEIFNPLWLELFAPLPLGIEGIELFDPFGSSPLPPSIVSSPVPPSTGNKPVPAPPPPSTVDRAPQAEPPSTPALRAPAEQRVALKQDLQQRYGIIIREASGQEFTISELQSLGSLLSEFPRASVRGITLTKERMDPNIGGYYTQDQYGRETISINSIRNTNYFPFSSVVAHELGHALDAHYYEFNAFGQLYRESDSVNDFARDYGQTNAAEDFATTVEAYMGNSLAQLSRGISYAQRGDATYLRKVVAVIDALSNGSNVANMYSTDSSGMLHKKQISLNRNASGHIVGINGVAFNNLDALSAMLRNISAF